MSPGHGAPGPPTSERESLGDPRLWLAFATMLLVSGTANTFPVFFPPLLAEFGGSRAATAFTVSLLWLGGALIGPVAGTLVDRGSPRLIVTVGLATTAVGLVGATLAPSLPVFVLTLGAGGGLGIGLTGMATQAVVVADAYRRRRGVATGIAFSGSMMGYALSAPLHLLIRAVGWRGALLAYAALVLALVPGVLRAYPSRLAARPLASSAGADARRPSARTVVLTWPFWALVVVASLAPLVGTLVTVQHALYFAALGFPAGEAAAMLAVGGVLSTAGRALAGLAADRFGPVRTGVVSYVLSLLGALCLVGLEFWPVRLLAWTYVLLVFLPLGTRATIAALLVGRIAPPALLGSVFGGVTAGNNLGAAVGPFLSGALYDVTRSYLVIFGTAVVLLVLALGALVSFARTAPADR